MIRIPTSWHCRLPATGLPAAVCSAVLVFCSSMLPAHAAPPSGAGWNLAWNDEFDGTSMDTTKWRHWLPGARRDAINSPSAVAVADGVLTISTYTSGGTHYTGMISTQDTYPYTYGYLEARINYDSNPGMWSAFWMQSPTMGNPIGSPNTAGTEIDICEHRKLDGSGANRDGNIGGVIHWDGYGTAHRSYGYDSGNLGLGTGYHTYGMEWTPTQQKFYIDGILRWTVNNNATSSPVSQRSEFIILSSEVEDGGWSSAVPVGGYGPLATTNTKMIVDYVRVYRRAETVVNGDFEGKISPFSTVNQTSWSATGGHDNPAAAKLAPTTTAGATVQQGVRGLLPDTGYTVTAWGNAGTATPSLFIGAKDHGSDQTGQTLTSSAYEKATAPFTTGPTNRTATVLAKSKNSGSTAYVDDFFLRRHATVNNGQLENGDTLAWAGIYGGSILSSDGTNYGGSYAWKIPASGSSAGVEQEVVGLSPSTAYRLTGWTTNGNAGLAFGVKNHGDTQVTSNIAANTWTKGTVNFTTGSSNTSATIFAYRSSSSTQNAYADSFFLSQPLAAPWTNQDVAGSGLSGIAGRLGGKFVLQGGGNNIGGSADQVHFLHQPVTGDATITARILGVDPTAYYAKTGVMIRESTAVGARSASVTWGPVNQLVEFNRRTSTDGSAASSLTSRDILDPPWLRLTRRGNTFTAYRSPDGQSWTRVGTPQTITMAAVTHIGIPACSGDTTRLAETALDNVTVSTPVPDVLITSPVEGTTHTGNGASLNLTATITDSGTPAITWSKVSGPGTVTFADDSLAVTSATFSATGTYILRCSAGTGSDDLTVNVAPAAAADSTLALRLKLDESSGTTATDSSGNNLHGTATGALSWQPAAGVLTGAASFNGVDSYLTVPDNNLLDPTSAFTVSYWFYANNLGNNTGLVAKRVGPSDNNSYGTFLGLDGKLSVDVNSSNNRFTSNTTFNSGTWYHIALVFNGILAEAERAKLYVNGILDKTSAETSTSIPNYTAPLYVGILAPGGNVFDGLIDEVRFHRRALSASEISAIKNETDTFAPTVSTGTAPAAIANTPATLNGSVSAATGPTPTAAWTVVSGPGGAVFGNPASPTTTVTFGRDGTYVLRLTAINANGETFAEFSDTVFPATLPPPGLTITNPPAPVSLAGASQALRLTATPDTHGVPGVPVFTWTQISGPGTTTFADAAAADTTATFSAPGTYLLRCTVTNAGGSDMALTSVTIGSPTASIGLRENATYLHQATFIRSDITTWNSGARDQMLIGRNDTAAKLFRSVFSFPLTDVPSSATLTGITLDLWTHDAQAGIGSVSTLELRELTNTPVEGTGSSGDSANINGNGTGATWINRTETLPWSANGGDFNTTVLSSVPGFNATTMAVQKSFPSSTAFLAVAQSAVSNEAPLNLMLLSPSTESGSTANFIRLASDDHANENYRPLVTLTWTANPAPLVNPGPAPAAVPDQAAALSATASGATSTIWSLVSGPGGAVFGNPASPTTTVTFDQAGTYILRITATNANAQTSADLTVTAVDLQPLVSILNPPGPVTLADAADILHLTASASSNGVPGTPAITWSQFSGPGTTIFADPTAADTTAGFSAPGSYILRCTVTTSGGSATSDVTVTVATLASATFRQGDNDYIHAATFLRTDPITWNSGARDQVLVGRKDTGSNFFRSVFSFPLTGVPSNATLTGITLDLWTHPIDAGTGTVSPLELRELTDTPVEGAGSGSTATDGAGTGATWNSRTGATTAGNLWTNPGGDFTATVLSSVPGFNATTLGVQKTFPSSSAFLAAAQSAVASASELNLMLLSPSTESGSTPNYTRLASDDHSTVALRPRLTLTWTVNPAPVIDPGPAPAATTGEPASLTATATGASSTTWSLVSGPGTATFGNSAQPATTVTFSQSGNYLLKLTAANPNGEVSRTLAVTVALNPAIFADWQSITWPGVSDIETIGPDMDPDHDGLSNFLEWALGLDATASSPFLPVFVKNGATLNFTYTRRITAPGEANFQVEWSDTLSNDWSDTGVGLETPVSSTDETVTVTVSIPSGTGGKRFVRLRVQFP